MKQKLLGCSENMALRLKILKSALVRFSAKLVVNEAKSVRAEVGL